MKLVMTLLVRDEEDIVDATVAYHLERGVDLVLVTDNLSVDRTRDLLAPFERAGVARVWSEPSDEYRQWEWVSRMAQAAATHYDADWVLHCDADEFWCTDRPLPEVLADVPAAYDVVTAPRHDFLPLDADDGRPFHERMTLRDTAPINIVGRPLMSKCAHRARDDVLVAQGNHFVVNQGMTEMPEPLDAVILHFPVRTYAQLERKVVLGGRAYARNRDMPVTVGNTWRLLLRAYLDGTLREWFDGLVPEADLLAAGMSSGHYVHDLRLREALAGHVPPEPLRVEPSAPPTMPLPEWRPEQDAEPVAASIEEGLLAFLDDARWSLDLVADAVSACGVLAALDSARHRGVAVRVLTADAAALAGWRLDEVAGLGTATGGPSFVVRDGRDLWSGPTELTSSALHARPYAVVARDSSAATPLVDAVDTVWARASSVQVHRQPATAGALP